MPGEKEDQVGIKRSIKMVLRDQSPLNLMKREIMPAEGKFPSCFGQGEDMVDMTPDRPAARILPGMNQGYPHNPVPPQSGV